MNRAKFAAIWVEKGQRVGFSDPVSPKITQRKKKEGNIERFHIK